MDIVILVIAVLLTSLPAGVFFGYATSINGALGRLKDRDYIRVMQHINEVIQNPLFLSVFMLPLALLPFVTFSYGGDFASPKFIFFAAATLFYVLGMFGITMIGNVPLNERLAKVDTYHASDKELAAVRSNYATRWNRLHTIRTVAGIVSVATLSCAILL